MAITDINLSGKIRADNGSGVTGATVTIHETAAGLGGSQEGSADTTDSDGTWSFTEQTLTETYDVKITSEGGGQIRYIPWSDEITLKTVDTSVLKVRGAASAAAPLYFFADRADDAGDAWRIQASASDTLAIGSDKASAGTIIDYITITNGANAADSTTAFAGTVTVSGNADIDGTTNLDAVDIDGNVQLDGTLTVGVDDTGLDVKFFGATAGSYMLWDESADTLILTDSTPLSFGDSADAKLLWETTDANAHYLAFDLPAGTSTVVPVVGVGIGLDGVDLGLFNGVTQPTLAVLDADRDSFIVMDHAADDMPRIRSKYGLTLTTASLYDINLHFGGSIYIRDVDASDAIRITIANEGNVTFSSTAIATISTAAGALTLDPTTNVQIGGTAVHGTTVGTNALSIFNGTAPVGTLSNGISLYSTSGELYAIDAAGNTTLNSPHDSDGNWIFRSKNTVTGRVLKVHMEKLMQRLDEMLGGGFIEEFIEEV